jgi:hypothetical protein
MFEEVRWGMFEEVRGGMFEEVRGLAYGSFIEAVLRTYLILCENVLSVPAI